MRVDVNISVRGEKHAGPRVEVKNVAGAKNVERALEYEYLRHIALLSKGEAPLPETRRYDADTDQTVSLRLKDEEPDYRFFQDPDLPQISVTKERIAAMRELIGEVPFETKRRFTKKFDMEVADVKQIFRYPWSIELFKELV